jgi:hypothetical protein
LLPLNPEAAAAAARASSRWRCLCWQEVIKRHRQLIDSDRTLLLLLLLLLPLLLLLLPLLLLLLLLG